MNSSTNHCSQSVLDKVSIPVFPTGHYCLDRGDCDINECDVASPSHNCVDQAKCVDFIGSYSCTCEVGYIGDGMQDGSECTGNFYNITNFI